MFYELFLFIDPPTTEIYTYLHTLSLHDALPILPRRPLPRLLPKGVFLIRDYFSIVTKLNRAGPSNPLFQRVARDQLLELAGRTSSAVLRNRISSVLAQPAQVAV